MAPLLAQFPDHTGIYARNGNKADEVLYAPYHRYTSQPAASILMLPCLPVPLYYEDLYNEGNTMKNLPTEALYLSLSLPDHRSMDKWYLPSLSWLPAETLRYRSACSCLPPAEAVEAHSHPMAHNHTSRSVRSESAHPSISVWRIPSHGAYNLPYGFQCPSPPENLSSFPWLL